MTENRKPTGRQKIEALRHALTASASSSAKGARKAGWRQTVRIDSPSRSVVDGGRLKAKAPSFVIVHELLLSTGCLDAANEHTIFRLKDQQRDVLLPAPLA